MKGQRLVASLYLACALTAACCAAEAVPKQEQKRYIHVAPFNVDRTLATRITMRVNGEPVENVILKIVENRALLGVSTKIDLRGVRGKRLTFSVKNTEVATVLAMIAERFGLNLYRSGDKLILSPPHWIRSSEMKANPFILLWSPELREPIWKRQSDSLAAQIRAIGVKRQRSETFSLLDYLDGASFNAHKYYLPAQQALISLSRIADADAAGPLRRLAKGSLSNPPALAPYYEVALARIRAEAAPASGSAGQKLAARLKLFLRYLALTPQQVESAARRLVGASPRGARPLPPGVLAIRQMADMVASVRMSGEDTSAAEKVVDFNVDLPARVKVQLAALAPHERVAWLVKRLAAANALDDDTYRLIQALGDEGAPAAEAIGRRLREVTAPGARGAQPDPGIEALLKAPEMRPSPRLSCATRTRNWPASRERWPGGCAQGRSRFTPPSIDRLARRTTMTGGRMGSSLAISVPAIPAALRSRCHGRFSASPRALRLNCGYCTRGHCPARGEHDLLSCDPAVW